MSIARSSQTPTSDGQKAKSCRDRSYPVGFLPVCLAVLCERCAAFMLVSSLVLMLCERYGYPRVEALRMAGLITAAGYLGSLPGGLIADRVLGHRRGLLASLLLLMAAYLLLALPTNTALWPSLTLLTVGNSLFKPSAHAVLRGLFVGGDPRLSQAQLWLHVVINVAAVLGAVVAGVLTRHENWSLTFAVSAVMVTLAGFALLLLHRVRAPIGHDTPPTTKTTQEAGSSSWQRLKAIATLTLAMLLFNVCYGQVEGSLLLWTQQHVDRVLLGFTLPPSWFVGLPSLLVLLSSPVQLSILPRLQRTKSASRLVAYGLMATSLAFVALLPAVSLSRVKPVSMGWLVACHTLLVVGETLVGTLGLAQVLRLAPTRWVGAVMGVWFLSGAIGYWLAGEVGALLITMSPTYGLLLLALLPFAGAGIMSRQNKQ